MHIIFYIYYYTKLTHSQYTVKKGVIRIMLVQSDTQ